jgi:D-alanyl-D-alanine carboxypeptidase
MLACGSELPDSHPPSVDGCSDLRPLLQADELRSTTRYEGENGFSFELRARVSAAESDIARCEQLERAAESLVARGAPGASIAYQTERFELRLARGLADIAARAPMSADGLVRVASVAKSYVGSLAALLATEGRLDLDNSDGAHALSDYLPETLQRIEHAERITVRQLLNHTSGIPDYYGESIGPAWLAHMLDSYHRGVPVSEEQALALVYGKPADFEPGTSMKYSNSAYLFAARVLDKVLGRPHQQEIHRRFLRPLRLDDSYFEKRDHFDMSRLSHGYRDASELGESFSDWYAVDQGYGFANGGITARLDQVARFFRAVPGGKGLPAGIAEKRFLATLRPREVEGYGLGLERNGDCYFHGGTFAGYEALAFHCTERDVSGALFINSSVPEHGQALFALGQQLMAH